MATAAEAEDEGCVRLAVVGDVHGQWSERDEAALRWLGADMALFVGDFGEEVVELVGRVAALDVPKAVILGNHDTWWTAKRPQAAFDSGPDAAWGGLRAGNAVRRQLEALGGAHVGYGSLGVPGGSVAVVGGRPFSNGGAGWNANAALAARVAGLGGGEAASAGAIRDAILRQPPGAAVVVLSHNGPAGLGSTPPDPCGVDWRGGPARPRYAPQGDHGDTDLAAALDAATAAGRPPALVVFGHMHSDLRMGGQRRMLALAPAPAAPHTLLLNAAVVPRVRGLPGGGVGSHFAVVSLRGGRVVRVRECWVEVGAGGSCRLAEHRDLFYLAPGEDGREVAHLYNAFTEQYETAEPPRAPPVPAI